MALHSLYCADVPLRNCSLTHSFLVLRQMHITDQLFVQNGTIKVGHFNFLACV